MSADAGTSDEPQLIDIVADELALARAQIDAAQPGLAEGTLRRRLARLEADAGEAGEDEMDALRLLLAESLWRQQRPVAARATLEAIRPGSSRRRLPMALLIEAEVLAAAGEADRAAGAQERLLASVDDDEAFTLRRGMTGRISWPLPSELLPEPARAPRAPWGSARDEPAAEVVPDDEGAAGRGRMEDARVAYISGDRERGDAQMSIALRLDASLAADGVKIIEPTLGRQPSAERLLLYGDLLRAAGREVEARKAFDRAAARRG